LKLKITFAVFEPPNDTQELSEYEEYCRRELPRVFRATLENALQNEAQLIENRLNSQLESMIRDCQDRVFASYRSGDIPKSQARLQSPLNCDPPVHNSTPPQQRASDLFTEKQDSRHTNSLQDHRELANTETMADTSPEQTTQSNRSTFLDASTVSSVPNAILSTVLDDDLNGGNFSGPDFDNPPLLNFNIDGFQDMGWDFMDHNLNVS
jgi:hypothetical protein